MPRLNNYLRTFRKRSGLAQKELALLFGCRHGSKISRYELGTRCPTLEALLAYAVVFPESTRELFAGEYERIESGIRTRAKKLHRQLDSLPFTPSVKHKMDFLTDVMYPRKKPNEL